MYCSKAIVAVHLHSVAVDRGGGQRNCVAFDQFGRPDRTDIFDDRFRIEYRPVHGKCCSIRRNADRHSDRDFGIEHEVRILVHHGDPAAR